MHAQLKSLEQQLDELISLARNLRGENLTLRQKLLLAENEKQKLEKKNKSGNFKVREHAASSR